MKVRYGLLVQTAQLLAQLFLDWCLQRQVNNEPFSFVVPLNAVETELYPDYIGVLVTVAPVKKQTGEIHLTELSVVQAIRSTIGNKDYVPGFQSRDSHEP